MPRYLMNLEFEGTKYRGWQVQQNQKTVQGTLYRVGYEIFGTEKIDIQGGGRTDAGVHALNMTAHLDANKFIPPAKLQLKFNDLLPADLNILKITEVGKDFHARHHAVKRSYIYQISTRRTAFAKNFVWWIKDNLNVQAMSDASVNFIGFNDFASFTDKSLSEDDVSTKVLISDFEIKVVGSLILIRVVGSHFLWKQVRRMVGVLAEVGRGSLSKDDVKDFLETRTNKPADFTAPPSGLFLEGIWYKGDTLPTNFGPVMGVG